MKTHTKNSINRRTFVKSAVASAATTGAVLSGAVSAAASSTPAQSGSPFKLKYAPNFRQFKHIHSKGFDGIVGMEHGVSQPGKEGEMRLIEAYREVDAFDV